MKKIELHIGLSMTWLEYVIRWSNALKPAETEQTTQSAKPAETLIDACQQAIDILSASRGKSTLDNYRVSLRSLIGYAGEELTVDSISATLMEGYQQWLLREGKTLNTVSCYMRSLRSLFGHIEMQQSVDDVFKNVFTGNCRTEKRALSIEDLHSLCQVPLAGEKCLQFARDLFLFSIYCLGMPFVDIAFLRKSQIKNGYIIYQRHKTGQQVKVKIEEPAQQIIDCYSRADSLFVFPILQQGTMHEYQVARSRYNRQLRRLGQLAHLSRQLTSYVARHSWASMAYHQNVDLSVISKALGHTSSKTTLIYLREIDDQRVDDANRQIIDKLTSKRTEED